MNVFLATQRPQSQVRGHSGQADVQMCSEQSPSRLGR
jgi:hypothetical protein